ncbi:hypothetical protein FXN65_17700 [Metapseudomonas lalkuanensis]|uniref:Uncharacterized protein n=1 Tax=Metapseudomonas lalkuanensis TaxID=2604832 RepID=A0A5J6QQF7_9GAMM|nr:hypothetical protein [Pseudomonas lalkuanensis]QEY63795.1 hypothetical protein FXN65_17700 [Pseudomonas lalkuanensis]
MKKKQSRSDWFHKDPRIQDWLKSTTIPWACDEYAFLTYLNHRTEDELKKIKQRWNSYTHRSTRKSLSCDISPATFSTLKKIQGKRGLTETIEEIININYEAKKHYKIFFEEKLKSRQSKKHIGISRELHNFSTTLEKIAAHRSELSKLEVKIEEQENQIATLRLIALTLAEKILNKGISLDLSITEHLNKILQPSSFETYDIPSDKNQME